MRSGLSHFAKGGLTKELQGSSIRNIPQNKLLGALSQALQGVDEFTKPARDIPYAGALVPGFESLGKTLEDASYGMPLTTGKGLAGTLNIKPEVGYAALEATQLPGLGKAGAGAAKGLGRIAQEQLPGMVARQMERSPIASLARPYASAVKEQGGQWLPGSAKEFVADTTRMRGPGVVDSWAEKQIPKYIEKYMGAKGDLLADALIPHGREMKRWEELTDPLINPRTVSHLPENIIEQHPWMSKLDPHNDPLYTVSSTGSNKAASNIGPVRDYISHVLDHAMTIPPEKLQQYDFPRLVKEVQKVDAARAAKMASVEGRAEGTTKFKEYPTGFHWAEVQSPEALKREGDIMGHCVGGYCQEVESGAKKIYSLRDPKGESHATVEVAPVQNPSAIWQGVPNEERALLVNKAKEKGLILDPITGHAGAKIPGGGMAKLSPAAYKSFAEEASPGFMDRFGTSINQIKGKQNLAPKSEYQPYIQDLIRSGNYGDVRDIHNSGLRKSSDVFSPTELSVLKSRGKEVGKYVSPEEVNDLQEAFGAGVHGEIQPGIPQMKKGGKVPCKGGGSCGCLGCLKRRFAAGGLITPDVINAVIKTESGGNPNAVSPKGAQGLGQFMPATSKELGINPFDPRQAREGASKYLNWLVGQTGSLKSALAAYNWGIGNIKKYGMDNLPKETSSYVDKVMALLAKHEAGTTPTVASAPINPGDTSPQPSVELAAKDGEGAPGGPPPSAPQSVASVGGGSGAMPQMSGYGKISGPMQGSIGTKSPMEMVSAVLKDPMSLANGDV